MSAVGTFRAFANKLREEPLHYSLGVTECKGVANIVIGSLQLAFSRCIKCSSDPCMKCSSDPNYHSNLSARHVQIGTKALKRGIWQILPVTTVITGACLTYRTWSQN
jgi:hypothetical protein